MNSWEVVGVALQLTGTGVAAWALRDNLRTYGDGAPVIPVARGWAWLLRKLGLARPQSGTATGSGGGEWGWVGAGRGYADIPVDAPMEDQMRFLRQRVAYLFDDVDEVRNEVGRVEKDVTRQVSDVAAESTMRDAELRADLAKVAAGSARQELSGLFLVVVGTVVSAFG